MTAFSRDGHLFDEALVLLAGGELLPRTLRHAERHLQTCAPCRERLAGVRTMDRRIQEPDAAPALPSSASARTQLQAALVEASTNQAAPSRWSVRSRWAALQLRPAMLLQGAAILALLAGAVLFRQATRPLQDRMAVYEETGPKPDHALTPGSASPVSIAEVCQRTDNDLDPPVPLETQQAVFRAYRVSSYAAGAYQVDYLINPQLGGDSSLQNLWPEPYHATVWNANAKDALETRLHGLVCSGQLPLNTAQQELSTDWIAAYKKYFHTERPVQTIAALDREAGQ